jgi:hypothetical protein
MAALIAPKKLSKQAQAQIDGLKLEVAHWRAKALAVANVDSGSTNVVLYGMGMDPDRGLPPNSHIRFSVGGRRFDVHIDGDSLAIRALDGMLAVRPSVSNVIGVVPVDR